jgi:hypothetical protein
VSLHDLAYVLVDRKRSTGFVRSRNQADDLEEPTFVEEDDNDEEVMQSVDRTRWDPFSRTLVHSLGVSGAFRITQLLS